MNGTSSVTVVPMAALSLPSSISIADPSELVLVYVPLVLLQKYRNTEIITVRVLDEAQHCGEALLTLEYEFRSQMAISYDSVGFYHIACGV